MLELKIKSRNEYIQKILSITSDRFIQDMMEYINEHRTLATSRYPLTKTAKNVTFWYSFFDDKKLIIIDAFSLKEDPDNRMIFCENTEERRYVNRIYNKYMDEEMYLE